MLNDLPIHPTLATADIERARAWYADKLGLQARDDVDGILVYEVGSSRLSVYQSEFAGTAKNTVAAWNVPDVKAEVARLRDRGVIFEDYDFGDIKTVDGIMTDPEGNATAWFKDADGNILSLITAPEPTDQVVGAMIAAADLDRARAWWSEKLGFEPERMFEGEVAMYRSGPASFAVYRTEFAGTAKNTVAAWDVPNLREEMTRLRSRGVVFEEYDMGDLQTVDGVAADDDGSMTAWMTDSEGNILGLYQVTADS